MKNAGKSLNPGQIESSQHPVSMTQNEMEGMKYGDEKTSKIIHTRILRSTSKNYKKKQLPSKRTTAKGVPNLISKKEMSEIKRTGQIPDSINKRINSKTKNDNDSNIIKSDKSSPSTFLEQN